MADKNQYIGEVVKNYDTPTLINQAIEIKSIRETVIPKKVKEPSTDHYDLASLSIGFNGPIKISVTDPTGGVTVIANDYDKQGQYVLTKGGVFDFLRTK